MECLPKERKTLGEVDAHILHKRRILMGYYTQECIMSSVKDIQSGELPGECWNHVPRSHIDAIVVDQKVLSKMPKNASWMVHKIFKA